MHGILYGFVIALSEILGYDNAGTDGKTDKEVDDQIDQRTCRTNRSQRNRTVFGKLSYNDIVRRIIQKL